MPNTARGSPCSTSTGPPPSPTAETSDHQPAAAHLEAVNVRPDWAPSTSTAANLPIHHIPGGTMTDQIPDQPATPPPPVDPPVVPAPKRTLSPLAAGLLGLVVGASIVGGAWLINA